MAMQRDLEARGGDATRLDPSEMCGEQEQQQAGRAAVAVEET
jgi:hypothetical protein